MPESRQTPGSLQASGAYPLDRLLAALQTQALDPDPDTRARAAARAQRWREVIHGIRAGRLEVGSRTPTRAPAWVTLEVASGGFATGRFLAGGELLEHERAQLRALGAPLSAGRARLNAHYLSEPGRDQLLAALERDALSIRVPEEAALVVVALLLERQQNTRALELIEVIRPWFGELRFYPELCESSDSAAETIVLQTVEEVAESLRCVRVPDAIRAQREALAIWNPLYDRLVALWSETVRGDLPTKDTSGAVQGGLPGQVWPKGWLERRAQWLLDYALAAEAHPRCGKHRHPKSNFNRLREALSGVGKWQLRAPEVQRVRLALANTISRHGAVGSPRRSALRAEQARVAALPSHASLAKLLVSRLERLPAQGGIPEVAPFLAPSEAGEADDVPAGTTIPRRFEGKLARALEAPLIELVERGVVSSAEVLARVLPQITAQVAAASLSDPQARRLYGRTYVAFRRRRSLLLLNLESQVRLEELPWVSALSSLEQSPLGTQEVARQTLEDVTLLALTAFPQTQVPNPLVSELRTLARRAGLKLPFVAEIAADIFMGSFQPAWPRAAAQAAELLEGSLYARYFDLDPAPKRTSRRRPRRRAHDSAATFAARCSARLGSSVSRQRYSWTARNGALLEQSQILTTQNLAALVGGLGLEERLRWIAPSLATRTLGWALEQVARRREGWRAELQAIKNAAYAWRQAIFFLSLCEEAQQREIAAGLRARLREAPLAIQTRFEPALIGLEHAVEGGRFDGHGRCARGGRRFLGWSLGAHWLQATRPGRTS